ncbi:hypothetical protein GW17_00059139 [Ensete ventricosum]|uniref:Bidirectional sugar transporter SWEET n=1 Tax=Ensete ventricosum TaxID=4639 RepID=A0A444C1G0_ENSVE|nr:hypothetical protein GW17_00059139 [Ensete ventricosum]RZR74163.1 hypothetical protein BHM03_00032944 [Ensete ventricosum]
MFRHRPTFVKIWKKGSVQEFSPIPYVATLLNCMMWVVYGLPMVHPHSMLVITINGSGLVIELSYVLLFIVYSSGGKRLKVLVMLLAQTAFVGVVALLVLTLAHTHERRSMIVGVLCVFFGTMMYAAPLSVMVSPPGDARSKCVNVVMVRRGEATRCTTESRLGGDGSQKLDCFWLQLLRHRVEAGQDTSSSSSCVGIRVATHADLSSREPFRVEYMPLSLSLASFFNGVCWTAYALIRFDPYITIPNGLGVMFAVAQLVLYAMYYKSTQMQVEAKKRKAELGLTELVVVKGDANKVVSVPVNGGGGNGENREM